MAGNSTLASYPRLWRRHNSICAFSRHLGVNFRQIFAKKGGPEKPRPQPIIGVSASLRFPFRPPVRTDCTRTAGGSRSLTHASLGSRKRQLGRPVFPGTSHLPAPGGSARSQQYTRVSRTTLRAKEWSEVAAGEPSKPCGQGFPKRSRRGAANSAGFFGAQLVGMPGAARAQDQRRGAVVFWRAGTRAGEAFGRGDRPRRLWRA